MIAVDPFSACLAITLREEGGFVHDDDDPGGVTNLGVTERNWAAWTGRSVTEAQMRTLTPAQVTPFYRAQYWQATSCDQLPLGLNLCVFDFAVNGGTGRAAMDLQSRLGLLADGHIGPATVRAAGRINDREGLIRRFQAARAAFYHGCKHFDHFGAGWLARVDRITTAALKMAG